MTAHAKFSPSSAHRWIPCPASIAMEAPFPNTSSKYADEGTAAHELLATCLETGADADEHMGKTIKAGTSEFTVDDEMASNIQIVIDRVRGFTEQGWTLLVEQRVEFSQHIGVEGQFGTADIILISPDGSHVRVEDLKYGKGHKVEASTENGGNEQLMTYALGVYETFSELYGPFTTVTVVVHQPRINWCDEYTCEIGEVLLHGSAIASAARMALTDVARPEPLFFGPGEDVCRWCKAKVVCDAHGKMIEEVLYATAEEFPILAQDEAPPPPMPKADRLGIVYSKIGMIEDYLKALKEEVTRRVSNGVEVIGADGQPMKLVEGRKGARKWRDTEEAEALLLGVLPPDKAYEPRKIITAAAAAKLLDKKATKAQWNDVFVPAIEQSTGAPTVALGSDPRPAFTGSTDAEDFPELLD